jgi:hypothetical protein
VLRTCREQEKGIPLLMELIFWGEDKEKKKKHRVQLIQIRIHIRKKEL